MMTFKNLEIEHLPQLINRKVLVETDTGDIFCATLEKSEDGYKWVLVKCEMKNTEGSKPEPMWLLVKGVTGWCELPESNYKKNFMADRVVEECSDPVKCGQ